MRNGQCFSACCLEICKQLFVPRSWKQPLKEPKVTLTQTDQGWTTPHIPCIKSMLENLEGLYSSKTHSVYDYEFILSMSLLGLLAHLTIDGLLFCELKHSMVVLGLMLWLASIICDFVVAFKWHYSSPHISISREKNTLCIWAPLVENAFGTDSTCWQLLKMRHFLTLRTEDMRKRPGSCRFQTAHHSKLSASKAHRCDWFFCQAVRTVASSLQWGLSHVLLPIKSNRQNSYILNDHQQKVKGNKGFFFFLIVKTIERPRSYKKILLSTEELTGETSLFAASARWRLSPGAMVTAAVEHVLVRFLQPYVPC